MPAYECDISCKHITMPTYQPIKVYENYNSMSTNMDDEDVELALRSPKVSDAANKAMEEKKSLILSDNSQQQQRLVSLDVFRGLTVALMILVDYAGGILPSINHTPWDGLTLADLVMPFFLFIVGVSLALTYKKLSSKAVASKKAILRALKLLMLGLLLQGGFLHGLNDLTYGVNVEQMRWMGILQRIAIAYLVGALCEIWLKGDHHASTDLCVLRKYRLQWVVASVLISIYLSLTYGLYVPDWEYQIPVGGSSSAPKTFSVKCGVRGDTGPACNAVGLIDRMVMGIQHLYRKPIYARTKPCSINSPDYGPLPPNAPSWCQAPFDPEGLLSSVMAIVTCLVGLHYGHIIIHFKSHRDRILHWMLPSTCLIVLGLALDLLGMHINKALYTFSYMCVTAGAAGILFAGIYMLVDVCEYRRMTLVLKWMGMHALMIYIIAACNILPVVLQGFYWKQPQNNILRLIGIGR
ncbi:hypothetical protein P3X46_008731 [Hevea brasiliensis]|uniref:Heparan-alpha-glucosaminide N-acetyltransferase catalytic domain-containing protein n=1 Tax=Hevea brasiliensis TaxID=3981 RepID=A0ABQ9MJL3_HEVBR|nr:uncharacterized protein LOC110664472 isoform X2 [Hevea brasiliensis]KAJ9180499.1 hypothetical protein P3X46_008731 [Hevea brasiliensis]